jgi:hypothetical protein
MLLDRLPEGSKKSAWLHAGRLLSRVIAGFAVGEQMQKRVFHEARRCVQK